MSHPLSFSVVLFLPLFPLVPFATRRAESRHSDRTHVSVEEEIQGPIHRGRLAKSRGGTYIFDSIYPWHIFSHRFASPKIRHPVNSHPTYSVLALLARGLHPFILNADTCRRLHTSFLLIVLSFGTYSFRSPLAVATAVFFI